MVNLMAVVESKLSHQSATTLTPPAGFNVVGDEC